MTRGARTNIDELRSAADAIGFDASLVDNVGRLLTVLAASKPGGRILELGTGAGLGTAYLLRGADANSQLVTVELERDLSNLAQRYIKDDRVEWVVADGAHWLDTQPGHVTYELIFADTWPGKFTHLDSAIELLAVGGLYVVDDLAPQANWPSDHQKPVEKLIGRLRTHPDLATCET